MTIVSVQTTAGRCLVRGDVVCELGTVRAHRSATVIVHIRAGSATGTLSDRAVVGTASLDPNLGNDVATAPSRRPHGSLAAARTRRCCPTTNLSLSGCVAMPATLATCRTC